MQTDTMQGVLIGGNEAREDCAWRTYVQDPKAMRLGRGSAAPYKHAACAVSRLSCSTSTSSNPR